MNHAHIRHARGLLHDRLVILVLVFLLFCQHLQLRSFLVKLVSALFQLPNQGGRHCDWLQMEGLAPQKALWFDSSLQIDSSLQRGRGQISTLGMISL